VHVGYTLFQHFDVMAILNIDDSIAINWLTLMESYYHSTVTYHTSTHAADVAQACGYLYSQNKTMVS